MMHFRLRSVRRAVFWGALVALLGGHAFAQAPSDVRVQQAFADSTALTAFVGVHQSSGLSLDGVAAAEATLSFGGRNWSADDMQPFGTSGQPAAYIFLIDVSRSISAARFNLIRQSLKAWIGEFGPGDRVGVLAFGDEVQWAADIGGSASDALAALDGIKPYALRTSLYEALVTALKQVGTNSDLPRRRLLIVISDGKNDDDESGYSREDVLNQIRTQNVPLYTIGMESQPRPPTADPGLQSLAEFAKESRGANVIAGQTDFATASSRIRSLIKATYILTADCRKCEFSQNATYLEATVRGIRSTPVAVDIAATRSTTGPNPYAPPSAPWHRWALLVVGLLALGVIAFIVWKNTYRREVPPIANAPQTSPSSVTPGRPGELVSLVYIGGDRRIEAEIAERGTIGSGSGCDLRMADGEGVADRHCELTIHDNELYVGDLSAGAGTFLNGVRIGQPRKVEPGDILRLGQSAEFRLVRGG